MDKALYMTLKNDILKTDVLQENTFNFSVPDLSFIPNVPLFSLILGEVFNITFHICK